MEEAGFVWILGHGSISLHHPHLHCCLPRAYRTTKNPALQRMALLSFPHYYVLEPVKKIVMFDEYRTYFKRGSKNSFKYLMVSKGMLALTDRN